jgi:hypothetical protein
VLVSARRFTLAALASLCVSCGGLALASAPALAGLTHSFVGQFGSFVNVQGVAVDESSGDVYVYDGGAGAIYKFSESGVPEDFSSTKTNAIVVPEAGKGEGEIAVDNSTGPAKGDIYVAHASNNVLVFNEAGEQVGELGEAAGHPWGEACGVAVDPSGNVYVGLHPSSVNKYTPSANPVTNADYSGSLYGVDNVCNVAADWAGNVYVNTWTAPEEIFKGQVTKYEALQFNMLETAASGTLVNLEGGGGNALAAEPLTNELYVEERKKVVQLNAAGELVNAFANSGAGAITLSESVGIAVDGNTHAVYVADGAGGVDVFDALGVRTAGAAPVAAASVKLEDEVDPEGLPVTLCEFEYGPTTAYGQRVPCETSPGSGTSYVKVTATLSGLVPLGEYHFRLVAQNTIGQVAGPDAEFIAPLGAPAVESESVEDVTAESASLQAQVNPDGAETTYHFEYGTSEAYGQSTPESPPIGSGGNGVSVAVHIQGLLPASTYHYRVVATNVFGHTRGTDSTFTAQGPGGSFALPDGRQYEIVSPPDKLGSRILPVESGGLIEAASGGGAMTFTTNIPLEANPQGFSLTVQNLSTRGPGGWSTRSLTVPHGAATGPKPGFGPEYRFFSSDLSRAIVQPVGPFTPCVTAEGTPQPCMSAEASEQTAFLGTDYLNGHPEEPCLPDSTSCARPLVSGCPTAGEACSPAVAEHADVPAGTVFGGENGGEDYGLSSSKITSCIIGGEFCGPEFVAATPDLSHVVISAEASLVPHSGEPGDLYEWSAGKLAYVGRGYEFESTQTVGGTEPGVNPISADGSRIIFTGSYEGVEGLLMHDMSTGAVVKLDAVQGGSGEGVANPVFQGASVDGSRVFFTDEQRLTANSGAGSQERDLYVCEIVEEAGKLTCRLTDLTPPTGGEVADVLGKVLGVSEDGSWVYFAANGALAPGAVRGTCPEADGAYQLECNLYVSHYNGSAWASPKLVTILSGQDYYDFIKPELLSQPTRVAPDGEWLAFMSQAPLTGYDNRDGVSGRPDAEVYLYNAAKEHLDCASCEPTGERPLATQYKEQPYSDDGEFAWQKEAPVAADLPGWQKVTVGDYPESYQSRYLTDSGRLFFNSYDALVPQDVNGTEDVYEYEPEGVGGCSDTSSLGSVVYRPARRFSVDGDAGEEGAGCVGLISSGSSAEESAFLDASEGGGEVFFASTAQLVPQDLETGYSVYDARECTVQLPCAGAPIEVSPCDTEASCRTSPTPQPSIYGPPPSATFTGPGDIAPALQPVAKTTVKTASKCRRGLVRKHGGCVRASRRKRTSRLKRTAKRSINRRGVR